MFTKYGGVCYLLIKYTVYNEIYYIGISDFKRYETCNGVMIDFCFFN
jgi:penicillin-binding protein-related factor A (putative recombinase)